ncbi:hypothetical protein [Oceanibaculum nanhaiense]|uniref:hypothetical protein n=1 Tax=Oceanibaculum nanhaiense TaxID=1909734 RepID=UPI003D2D7AEC
MGALKKRRRKADATGRSSSNCDRFVQLPHYMLRSAAWGNLSPNAKALLIAVWQRHNGSNNGEIAFAVRDASSIGLSKDVAARAFTELQDRGFLKLRRASSFTLKSKVARLWEVTAEPAGASRNIPATKDFMRWQPSSLEGDEKSETRSHQRDAQSYQRDSKRPDEIKLLTSVAPARPSETNNTVSQSHQRDTYILPCGIAEAAARTTTIQTDASATIGTENTFPRRDKINERDRASRDSVENPETGDTQKKIAISVRDRLKAEGASQRQLAAALGLSRPQLSNRLAGRFGLNQDAERKLREFADGEWSLGGSRVAA